MLVIWTNYVDMTKALPGLKAAIESGHAVRRDVLLLCGVGAEGGWQIDKATEIIVRYSGMGVAVAPAVATLASYRGHDAASWGDGKLWAKIASNLCGVLLFASRLPARAVAIDFEPYTDPARYPSWPAVGQATSTLGDALLAALPVLQALVHWRGKLFVAPGGLEYGLPPVLFAMRPGTYWLDEWTFGGDAKAIEHARRRRPLAEALNARFLPGLKTSGLLPESGKLWSSSGFRSKWIHSAEDGANLWSRMEYWPSLLAQ